MDSKKINPVTVATLENSLKKVDNCASKLETCTRVTAYWTPTGKYCLKHREEAMEAMRLAKIRRYGK
jgi:hypothetical protein